MTQRLVLAWANFRTRSAAALSHLTAFSLSDALKTCIIPLIVAVLGTWATNQLQNQESRRNKNTAAFIDEARTFDVVVANYVQKVLNDKLADSDAAQQVLNNLIRQQNLIDQVNPYLSTRDKHLVNDYKELLGKFHDVVPVSDSVLRMQAFWEDASQVLVVRNELIQKLQD